MAYIEFRPLTNSDGEVEYDLYAFTQSEAEETFSNVKERLLRGADDRGCFLRKVNWSDEKVEQLNRQMQDFYEKIHAVCQECRVFAAPESESA